MSGDATEGTSLDDAVELGVDAGIDGDAVVESDLDPTLDDLLTETLLSGDEDDDLGWGSDDDEVVEEPAVDAEAPATYVVKVDGQEIEVSLDELLGGYQRQADYTRKTQTLAEQAKELEAFKRFDDALRLNPAETLRSLAENLGVKLDGPAATPAVDDGDQGFVDPLEASVKQLQAQIDSMNAERQTEVAAAQNAARLAAVDAEIDAVRTKANDPDFDEAELLQFALDHQIGTLDVAWTAMKAIKSEAAAQTETARIEASKRALPPVEGGRARSAGATTSGPGGRMTFEQALDAAIKGS